MPFPLDEIEPGDHHRLLTVGSRERKYIVHVPPSYDGGRAWPVVLAFHGGGTDAAHMIRFSGLSETADQAGFLVVYPSGTGTLPTALTWNGGNCCGHAAHNQVDDVAFARALLDDLATAVHIDAKRVFATGMSNGAIMAYRLADELSERIAAIAPVAGPMGSDRCNPRRPVPVMHFHGTEDEFAPFHGGKGVKSRTGVHFYSVDHSIRAWVKADGCQAEPATLEIPDGANDGTTVTRRTYSGGIDGAEVVLFVIEGGGHTWPGRESPLKMLGKTTNNISANDLMWEFFQKHPMV